MLQLHVGPGSIPEASTSVTRDAIEGPVAAGIVVVVAAVMGREAGVEGATGGGIGVGSTTG
jgi:hypothetical protein